MNSFIFRRLDQLFARARRLNRPLFGTRILPADAEVDPAAFPEEEFPVYCPKCDYLLRGLPDGRCPECGEAFRRCRLLVEQYAEERAHHVWERGFAGRWALRLGVATVCAYTLWFIGSYAFATWGGRFTPFGNSSPQAYQRWVDFIYSLNWYFWWLQLGLFTGLTVCLMMLLTAFRGNAAKRRRILEAMSEH